MYFAHFRFLSSFFSSIDRSFIRFIVCMCYCDCRARDEPISLPRPRDGGGGGGEKEIRATFLFFI